MRFILGLVLMVGTLAHAAPGDVSCTAEQYEITEGALINQVKQDLKLEDARFGILTTIIGDHAYTYNPNIGIPGMHHLTISWGEGWTTGVLSTGSFANEKRVQISFVDKTKVFKLVCLKE
jgi:hypothetical protein